MRKRTHWRTTWIRVAGLIEKGLAQTHVRESHTDFLNFYSADDSSWRVCALGAGVVGKYGDPSTAERAYNENVQSPSLKSFESFAAEKLGIPVSLAKRINTLHCSMIPATEIITRLRRGRLADSW